MGNAWTLRTAADLGILMHKQVVETRRLSLAATVTLAIVACHGPVTRAGIKEIRGVAVGRGTLDQPIDAGWMRPDRRRQTPGRTVTFVVTGAFLDHFGLAGTPDLPGLAELRATGLLDNRPLPAGLAPGEGDTDIRGNEPGDDLFGD